MLKEYKRPDDGLTKGQRKEAIKGYKSLLAADQAKLRDAKIPVIVLVEGWDSAGKGGLINDLISEIQPATLFLNAAIRANAVERDETRASLLRKRLA